MKYKARPKSSVFTRRNLTISLIIVVLVSLGGLWYRSRQTDTTKNTPKTTTTETGATINEGPATDEEKQESQSNKDRIVQQNQQQNDGSNTAKKAVSPVITNATMSGVNAYISGVIEDGGTCNFTFIKGQQTFTKISQGFANATTTNCTPLNLSRSDFPSNGSWQVTLKYVSNSAEGSTAQASSFGVQ